MENIKKKLKRGTPEYREFMREIGQRGGRANVAKHGRAHMSRIGEKGGHGLVAKYGIERLSELGKIGSRKQWGGEA